jgi:hypothetical protein
MQKLHGLMQYLASELIASGVTTQPVETVLALLAEVTGDRRLKMQRGREQIESADLPVIGRRAAGRAAAH